MIVRAATDFSWLVERTGCAPTAGFRAIEAVDVSGRVRGMVGYDGWTEASAQAHVALDTPAALRVLLRPIFDYPFRQCGKSLLLGIIPSSNVRSCALAQRLGLRETYRVRDGWAPGDDLVIHELRREDCRWLT